jgi:PIN domain nuclease of toxin-antitoxin system
MKMIMNTRFIFDTCLLLFLARPEEKIAPAVRDALAKEGCDYFVSAISAWEIGLLASRGRVHLTQAPLDWFRSFVDDRNTRVLDVTPEVFVASSFLPQPLHNDPADRILIATAREHDLTIITRDQAILAYGAAGHVRALAC